MITVAIDAATDRLSVAARGPAGTTVERHLAGARGHARALLVLLEEVVGAVEGSAAAITRVIVADGPGSFTGLRVAATAAKAVVRTGKATLAATPSLLARARKASGEPGLVLAAASALRGEVYAGWYHFGADGRVAVVREASAATFESVQGGPRPDLIAGDGPDGFLEALGRYWAAPVAPREAAVADARALLWLAEAPGGVTEIADPATWEPVYGRPAEAQARWEREHGRPLPHP